MYWITKSQLFANLVKYKQRIKIHNNNKNFIIHNNISYKNKVLKGTYRFNLKPTKFTKLNKIYN